MRIIKADISCAEKLGALNAEFRDVLRRFRGIESVPDTAAGIAEMRSFLQAGWPVFAAEENGEAIGYLVCRVDEPCVWAEQLYVAADHRRKGIGGLLYEQAEALARSMGESTVYNYVHPNNDGIIAFLRSRGYTVLNLIEVRRPYEGEELHTTIRVNEHIFDY